MTSPTATKTALPLPLLPAKPFFMVRHGESEANRDEYCSGHVDVALTPLGEEQARKAGEILATLPIDARPTRIIHSHLMRARDTASLINQSLGGLPMEEHPGIAEQYFGEWERQPWTIMRPLLHAGQEPPGGETLEIFSARVQATLYDTLASGSERPLVVCHGGVFHAFGHLYGNPQRGTLNAIPYAFTPTKDESYPWDIAEVTAKA